MLNVTVETPEEREAPAERLNAELRRSEDKGEIDRMRRLIVGLGGEPCK